MSEYTPLQTRELPPAPHWSKAIGVGIVVMGLAIGTGELIMWPHLVTKHGLGILWAAVLGITLQFFINYEVARHALATGESFFTTSARLWKWIVPFWLFSAVLLYIWPGWAAAIGTILRELFGFGNYIYWAWATLGLVLVLTFSGRIAYVILEKTLKIIVPLFFVLLLVISFFTLDKISIFAALKGIINFGWIPEDIDLAVFLGAIVFAGAGGLLNLCTSLWYRDKQAGMGHYVGRIINPITAKPEAVAVTGYTFNPNKESMKRWRSWMRYILIDQGIIFWFLGLITLLLLSVNAYVILTPLGLVPEGLNVAVFQAHIFGEHWGKTGFNVFLVMAFLMLFAVMWTVIDAFTRIVSDILFVNSRTGPFKKHFSWFRKISLSHLYYGLIVGIVVLSAFLIPLKQPLALLTISAVLGSFVMAVYIPFIIFLNNRRLPKELRPKLLMNIAMIFTAVFYIYFAVRLIASKII